MDGLKGYVALVSGLTEATAAKAREVATALLAQGGIQAVPSGAAAMATQITGLAEDLLVTARDNRGALLEVVRIEAERAVATLGVVTAAEADGLRRRIAELEAEIAQLRASATPTAAPTAATRETTSAGPRKPTAKKATSRQAAPKQAAPKQAAPKKAAPKKAAPRKAAPKKAAPTKTAPRRATAKKAAPRRAVAPTTTVTDAGRTTGRTRNEGS